MYNRKLVGHSPWPVHTVIIISILFTPAIGGIIAGINQRRMGFSQKAWLDYTFALIAFAGLLYTSAAELFALALSGGNANHSPLELLVFIPSLSLLFGTLIFPLFIAPPVLYFLFITFLRQKDSLKIWRMAHISNALSWADAYLFAVVITAILSVTYWLFFSWAQ